MLIDVNPEDIIEFGWEAVTSRRHDWFHSKILKTGRLSNFISSIYSDLFSYLINSV